MDSRRITHTFDGSRVRLQELDEADDALDLIDLARSIMERRREEPHLRLRTIAAELGRSQPWVSNVIRLLKLIPEGQDMVRRRRLSLAHGKVLAGRPPSIQAEIIALVLRDRISSHRLEELLRAEAR